MKRLGTRVNLIPIVSKADTLTPHDLAQFKQRVRLLPSSLDLATNLTLPQIREVIQAQGIRVYSPPVETDDEASAEHARVLNAAMPFSIIGSTQDVQTADGRTVKGREYLWGVAEGAFSSFRGSQLIGSRAVENEEHCDFKKLRSLLIRTHMLDLIATSEESHYENYRQAQMETRKFG